MFCYIITYIENGKTDKMVLSGNSAGQVLNNFIEFFHNRTILTIQSE